MIASLAALLLGIFGAIKLRPVFASLLDSVFNISPDHINVIAFAVAFVTIVLVIHLIAFLVDKLVKAVALNFVNRLLGMAFGLLVTAFVISMTLLFIRVFFSLFMVFCVIRIYECKSECHELKLRIKIFDYE